MEKDLYDLWKITNHGPAMPLDRLALELEKRGVLKYNPATFRWVPLQLEKLSPALAEIYVYKYTLSYHLEPLFKALKGFIRRKK